MEESNKLLNSVEKLLLDDLFKKNKIFTCTSKEKEKLEKYQMRFSNARSSFSSSPEKILEEWIKSKNICLASFVANFIRTTQMDMIYFDREINCEIAKNRNTLLIMMIEIFYNSFFENCMDINLKAHIEEALFNATLANYSPQLMRKYQTDCVMNKAFSEKKSLSQFRKELDEDREMFKAGLSTYAFIEETKKKEALTKCEKEHTQLQEEYKKSTLPEQKFTSLVVILFLIGFLLVITGQIFFGISLILINAPLQIILEKKPYGSRKMSDAKKREYANLLEECSNQLGKLTNELTPLLQNELRETNQNIIEAKKKNLKLNIDYASQTCLFIKTCLLQKQLYFVTPRIHQNSNDSKNIGKMTKPKGSNPIYILSIYENNKDNDYSITNLRNQYPHEKREKQAQPTKSETIKASKREKTQVAISDSDYKKLVTTLDPDLQKRGYLVVDDQHMIFVELGKKEKDLDKKVKQNLANNKYKFGAPKGEFDIFKKTTKNQWRLKLFDGIRIDFNKEGNIQMLGKDSSIKTVPRYVAIQKGNK